MGSEMCIRDRCWIWTGEVTHGYGTLSSVVDGTRTRLRATRLSLELAGRPVPEGMHVLHRCDNPPCVNPDHLFAGTPRDNVHDMARKGRDRKCHGEVHGFAKFTDAQILEMCARYRTGELTAKQVCAQYGIGYTYFHKVLKGRERRHLYPGTPPPKRKRLTSQDADCIRKLYATGIFLQKELARAFGIATTHAGKIINGGAFKEGVSE